MKLSKYETSLLKSEINLHIYAELMFILKNKYKSYFKLLKLTLKMENEMLEKTFMRFIISDILSTEDYSIEGIALYTDTPKDVVIEIASGVNLNPSIGLFLKIIALHRSVRPALYKDIMSKFNPEEDPDAV